MSSGCSNLRLGNARTTLKGGGGSGEPTTREVVQGWRTAFACSSALFSCTVFSGRINWPLSEPAGVPHSKDQSITSYLSEVIHGQDHGGTCLWRLRGAVRCERL